VGQRVSYSGPARKFSCAVGKHFWRGAGLGQRGKHIFQRLGEKDACSLLAYRRVRIRRKNAERLDTLLRRKCGRFAADSQLSLLGRAA
jgi:hypothetical protein